MYAGPVADECCQYAHFFRLDERLARSLTHASVLSSVLVAGPLAYVTGASHPAATYATRRALSAGMLAGEAVLAVRLQQSMWESKSKDCTCLHLCSLLCGCGGQCAKATLCSGSTSSHLQAQQQWRQWRWRWPGLQLRGGRW